MCQFEPSDSQSPVISFDLTLAQNASTEMLCFLSPSAVQWLSDRQSYRSTSQFEMGI